MTYGIATDQGVTLDLASRWTRFLGQMIDGSFAALPMFVSAFIGRTVGGMVLPLLLASVAWSAFYFFLADGLHEGQSFAKQWLGVRVVSAKTGAPCSFGQSFVRNVFTIFGPLDWIFIFGERHQRLGDKVAGTIVVIAD